MFSLISQLDKELNEYFQDKIHLAGQQNTGDARYLSSRSSGFMFSQWETLNTIELYYNSKFETGLFDSEGQRKAFLNICKFRTDVAAKQVDLDVKDFVFVPDDGNSIWKAFFLNRQFKKWAKEDGFGQLINDCVRDFPKYGSVVLKRCKDELERVPLLTLRNPHNAKSLKKARFVIEEHKDMTFEELQEKGKVWDISKLNLKPGETVTVYERYGFVPQEFYKRYNGEAVEAGDEKVSLDCLAIIVKDKTQDGSEFGQILFLEEVDERPYEEAHWDRVDGRWLGLGEVENQFENQIMRNATANMRRRGLLWASKKIFQSRDPEIAKNLVKDVRDGDVLKIAPNGDISQVNMATQSLQEFQNNEDMWERNSDQKSFTFEVATGEGMSSGTPYRLGVILSNAVNSHFNLKRENLGLFFNRVIMNQVIEIFKKENKDEHELIIMSDEEGATELEQEIKKVYISRAFKNTLLSGQLPDLNEIEAEVTGTMQNRKAHEVKIPEKYYDDCKVSCTLVVTGENVNLEKRIETLTNLHNVLMQSGNAPAAEKVLKTILSLTGENYDLLAGSKLMAQPQQISQPSVATTGTAFPTPTPQTNGEMNSL